VKPETAARWVAQGISKYTGSTDADGKYNWVTDPDNHSHSWLTLDEWLNNLGAHMSDKWDTTWRALTAAAKSYAADGHEVRFIFWFDN
jgi:hypothetical protein